MSELPKGWSRVKLTDIAEIVMGQSPPSNTYNLSKEGLPFFQGKAEFTDLYPQVKKYCSQPLKIAKPGDVLISVRAPVGPTNLCPEDSCIGRGLAAIRSLNGVPSRFLLYYLRSIEEWLSEQGTGSTFTAISKSHLQNINVPLPPLDEQWRIVAKLEKLLSRVNAAQARLAKIPILLARFRQSVLAAACSGRLTADWRNRNATQVLADYKEDKANALFAVPSTWCLKTVEEICDNIVDCPHSTPTWSNEGYICVRTTNFRPNYLDLSDVKFVSEQTYFERIERIQPRAEDILYSREGGILGVACMIPRDTQICLGQRMMLLRAGRTYLPQLLMFWLNSPEVRQRVDTLIGGSASPHLNVRDVKKFSIPVPPIDEQEVIVNRVEYLSKQIDLLEISCYKAWDHINHVNRSILTHAFEGKLS